MALTERQHKMRLTGIGGSEVAAVVGESPFGDTQWSVWKQKLYGERLEPSNAMRFGNYVEASIAAWYVDEMGGDSVKLTRSSTRRHPEHKWMLCTPDRIRLDGDKPRLVQIKSVGPRTQAHWGDDPDAIPDYVRLQILWEGEVTGIPDVDVAVLFLADRSMKVYRPKISVGALAVAMDICRRFWFDNVLGRVEPPIDGSEACKEYLEKKYAWKKREMLEAPPEAEEWAREYVTTHAKIKELEARKQTARNRLCALIGEADGITGRWGTATWKPDDVGKPRYKELALSLGATEEQINQSRGEPERKMLCKLTKPA